MADQPKPKSPDSPRERIPQERDPEVNARRMDWGAHACRDDADRLHWLRWGFMQRAWRGVQLIKAGPDITRYWTVIRNCRPGALIETGAQAGGSTLMFMDMLQTLGIHDCAVVSIDIEGQWDPTVEALAREYKQPLIRVKQDCLAPEAVDVARRVIEVEHERGRRVIVTLDSVHTQEHVIEELRLYAPLLAPGDVLVVEDTDHNGQPVLANYGPSAYEAVQEFYRSPLGNLFEVINPGAGASEFSNCTWLRRGCG